MMIMLLIIASFLLLAHFYVMNIIAMYTGTSAKTKWIVPRAVLYSREHLGGIACIAAALFNVIIFDLLNMTEFGFVMAVILLLGDLYFIGLALKRHG